MSNALDELKDIEHNHFELVRRNSGEWFCLISRGNENWFSLANKAEDAIKNTIRLVVMSA